MANAGDRPIVVKALRGANFRWLRHDLFPQETEDESESESAVSRVCRPFPRESINILH